MIRYVLAAAAVLFSVSANAATFEVKTYESGDTYIKMEGNTTAGDVYRLNAALDKALALEEEDFICESTEDGGQKCGWQYFNTFSWELQLDGPGGSAAVGAKVAEIVNEQELYTVVSSENVCVSACALIWMAAGEDRRWIQEDSYVGFHFAYTDSVEYLEKQKDLYGWIGIQDQIAQSSHYFTGLLFKYGVADPYQFMMYLSHYGEAEGAWWVSTHNIDIVGGKAF